VVAVRAAYGALILGLAGGLWLATTVLSTAGRPPLTVREALGVDPGSPALDARRAAAVAELTAKCMDALGLDWRPRTEAPPDIPDAELDPVAWADHWGFGVSTRVGSSATALADPDLAMLAAMPADARDRYRAALYGSGERPGCHETARVEVYGLRDRLLRPIRPRLDALEAAIGVDAAMVRALTDWRGCVAPVAAGLRVDRSLPAGLIERIATRAAAVASGTPELRDLQAEERHVAGVLARCELRYTAVRETVARRYEAPFVARNSSTLAGIGAAIRAAEAALPTLSP
jgi:hypothetical protein